MQGFRPVRPSGSDPEFRFHQSTWDKTHGPESRINTSSTVSARRTSHGISLKAAPPSTSGSKLFLYRITSLKGVGAEFFMAKRWNVASQSLTGSEVPVAKYLTARFPEFETIDGMLVRYSYENENLRKASFEMSGEEWQVVHDRYTAYDPDAPQDYGNLIHVARIAGGTGVMDDSGGQIYFQEVAPARFWAYQYDQSGPVMG